jgi:hypothetical protein
MSNTSQPSYQIGTVNADDIDTNSDSFDFAVDTALSWDGEFPDPGVSDYLVTVDSVDTGELEILVSRRYVSAHDPEDAAAIALDAFAERHDYERDNNGTILEILDPSDPDSGVKGMPCWIVRVDAVTEE